MRAITRFDLSSTLDRPLAEALAELINEARAAGEEFGVPLTAEIPPDLVSTLREIALLIRDLSEAQSDPHL